jgi:hypothetical protein
MCKVNKLVAFFGPPQLKEKDSTVINKQKIGEHFRHM